MVAKLLGYRQGTSKKGTSYCMLHVVEDFQQSEKNDGAFGQKVETLFAPKGYENTLRPQDIGKELDLEYTISNGRAFLVSIVVNEPSAK